MAPRTTSRDTAIHPEPPFPLQRPYILLRTLVHRSLPPPSNACLALLGVYRRFALRYLIARKIRAIPSPETRWTWHLLKNFRGLSGSHGGAGSGKDVTRDRNRRPNAKRVSAYPRVASSLRCAILVI